MSGALNKRMIVSSYAVLFREREEGTLMGSGAIDMNAKRFARAAALYPLADSRHVRPSLL